MVEVVAEFVIPGPEPGGIEIAFADFFHFFPGGQNLLDQRVALLQRLCLHLCILIAMKVTAAIDPCLFTAGEVGQRVAVPDDEIRVLARFQ